MHQLSVFLYFKNLLLLLFTRHLLLSMPGSPSPETIIVLIVLISITSILDDSGFKLKCTILRGNSHVVMNDLMLVTEFYDGFIAILCVLICDLLDQIQSL